MARMEILKPEARKAFDRPPILTSGDRKRYLKLTEASKLLLNRLRTPHNQVYFLLSLAYFKINKRFYTQNFPTVDLRYAAKQLAIDPEVVIAGSYDRVTQQRHKQMILEHVGFEAYSEATEERILPELHTMIHSQKRPKLIFEHVVESLIRQRTEVPTYFRLYSLISRETQRHKVQLLATVKSHVSEEEKRLLDDLLEQVEVEGKLIPHYTTTLLKRFSQSVSPKKIKGNVADVKRLDRHYQALEGTLAALALPREGLRYYAQSVLNAKVFQVARRSQADRYLHLMAFVAHQFYRGQDVLVDTLLKTTQTVLNTVDRDHKDKVFEHRKDYRRSVKRLVTVVQKGLRSPLDTIESITASEGLDAASKLERIEDLFKLIQGERATAEEELDLLNDQTRKMLEDAEYYELLESRSRKLQNRVAGIIKFLDFKGKDEPLLDAITYFQTKDGSISSTAPIAFLKDEQRNALLDDKGKFRVSLYKVFLFMAIAEKLKAGRLHLRHSYKYRSLDDYLIALDKWLVQRDDYLRRAGMTGFSDAKSVLEQLKLALDEQYHATNQNILTAQNPYFKATKKGFVLSTPKADRIEAPPLSSLFPKGRYISLVEVLHTINGQTGFLECFEHWQQRSRLQKPGDQTFFAGIMGYGCNIGIDKLVSISRSLQGATLENTTNWYFSLDNLLAANDKVLAFIDAMSLADIYRSNPEQLHTSSDGQKFELSVESLLASHSFKYFGQNQGVSSYSFTDERNLAFYSTVISANEREVAYVIDGLMHNDVVQSDIHSTDSHGYSEALFGVTHLLDFYFAPRIKGFARQRLYSFERIAHYKALGYAILPNGYIDTELIERHWDDILRFAVTIKLKEATASQLFKRLNSYAKQNPIYRALKEFGKIIKSLFMLNYTAEVKLRQAVEKQLNKGELGNRFNKAISFGGNHLLGFAEKESLDVAEACRRLIKNSVLCWNYLYLSKQLSLAEPDKQAAIIRSVRAGSPVAWRHINMHGEYDFSDEKLVDSVGLANPNLIDLNHLDNWDAMIRA